jgi:exonuclease VII small subunit
MSEQLGYEAATARLDELVARLENGASGGAETPR